MLRQNAALCQKVWELVTWAGGLPKTPKTTNSTSARAGGAAPEATFSSDANRTAHDASEDEKEWFSPTLGVPQSPSEMFDLIDMGFGGDDDDDGAPDRCGSSRTWAIDPIDGTQAYLQGGQYVVAAALLVQGTEQVGVLGCPHLSMHASHPPVDEDDAPASASCSAAAEREKQGEKDKEKEEEEGEEEKGGSGGYILSAVRGEGSRIRRVFCSSSSSASASPSSSPPSLFLSHHPQKPLHPISAPPSASNPASQPTLRIAENFRPSRPSSAARLPAAVRQRIARLAGAQWPPMQVHSTQMLYVAVATGHADAMMRVPGTKTRLANVWDHAGGMLILEETSRRQREREGSLFGAQEEKARRGYVTDVSGQRVDCGAGRKLRNNTAGIIAGGSRAIHDRLLDAVQVALAGHWKEDG